MKKSKERQRIERIHALIALGEAPIARGEGIPYTEDFMDNAIKRAKENHKQDYTARGHKLHFTLFQAFSLRKWVETS
jgi:hypothetical protein